MVIIENSVERHIIEDFKRKILEIMSMSDFSIMTIQRLKHFNDFRSDPNIIKKAIRSLRKEGLIASSQGTSESHLEEEIP